MNFDIAIIGGGPAGYTAAERAGANGLKAVLFEKKAMGGVCLNEGCIPTKTLLYSAKILDSIKSASKYGVSAESPSFDLSKIMSRKDKTVKMLTGGVKMTVSSYGVAIIEKEALIEGEKEGKIQIEDYIVGTANGMSRFDPKIHVVIEGAEFADYFWPAVEQYVECTHEYWRSNGKFAPNITLRLASGGYIGGGLYHSQNLEGALTTLPGARIVCPSFADDAAGLLRTSMRSKGFTLFLEPKALYNSVEAAAVVPEDFEVPFGKARIRREGSDLSIITYGNTTHFCLHAAERLEKEGGWKVEVIDIRSLIPLDKEAIFESVKKTSKALVVHEDKVFSGFGAELAAMISGEMFRYLDGPVQRVGSTFTPVGFNPILEKEILPDKAKIYEAAQRLLEY